VLVAPQNPLNAEIELIDRLKEWQIALCSSTGLWAEVCGK
jgi:hypothetical protein